jgi:hypothetical protein
MENIDQSFWQDAPMDEDLNKEDNAILFLTTIAIIIAAVILLCTFWPGVAHAEEIPKTRAVNAIIGESEGECYKGKLAVACAIRTRGTLQGVYGEHSRRVREHLYGAKVFVDSVRAWDESAHAENCAFLQGASFWEGTKFEKPYWAKRMTLVVVIGKQAFYRKGR